MLTNQNEMRYALKTQMKIIALILTVFVVQSSFGQYYIRTKKNIGVYSNYNFGQVRGLSSSYQLGICSQFGGYVIPEIGVSFVAMGDDMLFQSFTGAIQFRKRLLKINERKRGAKCIGEIIDIFVAPEYFHTPNNNINLDKNTFSARYGLAIHHYQSGGSKRARTWNTKLEAYHRTYFEEQAPLRNEIGVALRIQYFKTYDFLR